MLNQSFQDLEVILMDDCSSDNSRAIIAEYAAREPWIRVVLNEQNSGSTFRQWNKGIALAQGEYVWLAESDDYANSELLTELVARLDAQPGVGLAYCQSFSVDERGQPMPTPTWEKFLNALDPQLWRHDFTRPGRELVRRFMSYRNIIPNASAVLLRRATLAQVGPADESFRVLGDWMFWARILAVSDVAFVARPLNYFRTHRNNVRTRTEEDGTVLLENVRLLAAMRQYGAPDPIFYRKAVRMLLAAWYRSFIYYRVPAARHRAIYQHLAALDPAFQGQFRRKLRYFLLRRRLSGVRLTLGDKLLYPLLKKLR